MKDVLKYGTGAGVHALGFNLPAAGKTGTSHDGWFAGFTSNLLCIVWVGFDDYRQLDLEGARSALPIWAEFMKRAAQFRAYKDVKPFQPPSGVVSIQIDPDSGMPSTAQCPKVINEVFIAGTEPVGSCPLHGGSQDNTNVSGWEAPQPNLPQHTPGKGLSVPVTVMPVPGQPRPPTELIPPKDQVAGPPPSSQPADNNQPEKKKKRGFFGRIFHR